MKRKRLSPTLLAAYRKNRERTVSAHYALAWARSSLKRKPRDWGNDRRTGLPCVSFKHKEFVIFAKLEIDEDNTALEFLGSFESKHEPGAIARFEPDSYRDSRECRWFVPAESIETIREAFRSMGYSRGMSDYLARKQVYENMARAEDFQSYSMRVTASRAGVELARNYLGGIDTDDTDYLETVVDDMLSEVINEARATLAKLCRGKAC